MLSLTLGVAAACAASALYNLGIVLQALEARVTPAEHGMRLALVASLLRRPRWVAGTLLGVLGWPLQALALLLAPLTIVQPTLAFGLTLLLVIGASRLHERVGRREIMAVAAIVSGVCLLALVVPDTEAAHAGLEPTALVLGAIALVGLAPFLPATTGRRPGGLVAALGAGAAFAWSGLSTKYAADAAGRHAWLLAGAWALATGIASGVALISEMTALQRRSATHVAPLVFVVQVMLPVLAAPLLLGERWTGSAVEAVEFCCALAILLTGAALLAASRTVTGLVAAKP